MTPRTGFLDGVAARLALALLATAIAGPAPLRAQDGGSGTTGAVVLELPAGSRATAFAGAYTAGTDIDALFYNPAGAGRLDAAAGLAYESFVADITLGSAAAALRVGPVVLGAAISYLDGGSVDVLEPDPAYGGQTGRPTGATATAGETAAKLAVAVPLPLSNLRVGAALGYVSSDLANTSHSGAIVDLGLQYDPTPAVTVGAAVRNIGGSLSGPGDAPLPREARFGVSAGMPLGERIGGRVSADYIAHLEDSGGVFAGGVELGLLPDPKRHLSAVGRIGYGTQSGSDGLGGELRLGAGVGLGPVSLDYTYQSLDFFGAVHRFGIRWSRGGR